MSRSVETLGSIRDFAVRDIDITGDLSVGVLTKSSNNQSVFRVEIFFVGSQVVDELNSFAFDSDFVSESGVVGVNQVKLRVRK